LPLCQHRASSNAQSRLRRLRCPRHTWTFGRIHKRERAAPQGIQEAETGRQGAGTGETAALKAPPYTTRFPHSAARKPEWTPGQAGAPRSSSRPGAHRAQGSAQPDQSDQPRHSTDQRQLVREEAQRLDPRYFADPHGGHLPVPPVRSRHAAFAHWRCDPRRRRSGNALQALQNRSCEVRSDFLNPGLMPSL